MELNSTTITTIGLLFTLFNLLVGYVGYNLAKKRDDKQDKQEIKLETKEDTVAQTELKMSLEYISRGIDDIRLEIRDMKTDAKMKDEKINNLTVKYAQLEASLKSEHKRLDEHDIRLSEIERERK
ncbi:MAG: hypothetical protein LIR50_05710 [Bacillota bacterium]|nr:hypothetical protein [Bacillota bacterium]